MTDTASSPIWWPVALHLVDTLRAHALLDGVQVEDGYPGEVGTTSSEVVYVDEITSSDISIPVATGGAKHYDDIFTVWLVLRVAGRKSRREAITRLAEIDGAVLQVLATDPTLDDMPGVVSAEITERRQMAPDTSDGPRAHGMVAVTVHSRITP